MTYFVHNTFIDCISSFHTISSFKAPFVVFFLLLLNANVKSLIC